MSYIEKKKHQNLYTLAIVYYAIDESINAVWCVQNYVVVMSLKKSVYFFQLSYKYYTGVLNRVVINLFYILFNDLYF